MKNVLAFTLGSLHPSARMRLEVYQRAWREAGWNMRLHPFVEGIGSDPAPLHRWQALGRTVRRTRMTASVLAALRRVGPAAPIVVSRELPIAPWPILRASNPLILDLDDALYLGPGREAIWRLCRGARTVVCGNALLAAAVSRVQPNCVIIPTVVEPADYLERRDHAADGTLRLGWLGSSMSIDVTLLPLLETLHSLPDMLAFELVVIADALPKAMRGCDWIRSVPWSPAAERALAESFDVGLMLLRDEPFQAAKCGAKLLQYMAAGLPVVATPLGVNRDIVTDGVTGYWAQSGAEWRDALLRLAADASLRAAFGQAGRSRVQNDFSVARWAPAWIDLLERAQTGCATVPAG
jgi:hypothetical protein